MFQKFLEICKHVPVRRKFDPFIVYIYIKATSIDTYKTDADWSCIFYQGSAHFSKHNFFFELVDDTMEILAWVRFLKHFLIIVESIVLVHAVICHIAL